MKDRNEPMEEKEFDSPLVEDKSKQPSGQYLWRVLKPAGCILVLLLFVLYLVVCFTYKGSMPENTETTPNTITETE